MPSDYYKQDVNRLRGALRHFSLASKPPGEEGICSRCGHPIIEERIHEMGDEIVSARCRCHKGIPLCIERETNERD